MPTRIGACLAVAGFLLAGACQAVAAISSVGVHKMIWYLQTGPRNVFLNNVENAYSFEAAVWGTALSGMTAPALTGPINTSLLGPSYTGRMTFGFGRWLLVGDYASAAALDARFGSGAYTVHVNGTPITVTLAGDAYPDPPLTTFIGGAWIDGMYHFDPERPLVVSTSAHSAPSPRSGIAINWPGGGYSQGTQLASAASFTIPANTFTTGAQLTMFVQFQTTVDDNATAMPGVGGWAGYGSVVEIHLLAQKPQVFPMTVNVNPGPTVTNATVTFQPRPQDVGTQANLYAFFVAPATLVRNASTTKSAQLGAMIAEGSPKDDPVACVLAQLSASGQLQAVSTSSLQAFATYLLSSQAQAANVINNVPTANILGSALYIGYGTSAQSMIATGVNQRAYTAAGSLQCDPKPPQTGWWWNPAEPGRGYSIEVSGNALVFASYLYDASGRATWLLASGPTSIDGSLFPGRLEGYSRGQTLTGTYRAPAGAAGEAVTLAFSDASHGTLVWPGGAIPIERFNIVPGGLGQQAKANQPESGWWWNKDESGRGFFLEWQGGQLFMTGYMYDDAGNPIWYLSGDSTPAANIRGYSNVWQLLGNGQTLTGAHRPPTQVNTNVGPVSITFHSATMGSMTLPGGRVISIERYRF